MKTKTKGNRIQLKLIKELEKLGYTVGKVENGGKFTKVKDLFGLFDLVAIGKNDVCFIQVTCNRPHTHKRYLDFSIKHDFSRVEFLQYVWYDRKGWVIFIYVHGKKLKYDMRK